MSRAPRIGVLALQGDVREHVAALAAVGAEASPVRTLEDVSLVDALVIPGGESTTMSKLAVRDGFVAPIADRIANGMPTYGSCAGMIMLSRQIIGGRDDQVSFGGLDAVVRRNAFGSQVHSFEADVPIPALGIEPFPCVFIRAPWIESVGPDVEVLGTIGTETGEDRIVAVQSGTVLATSFHPELTPDHRVHEHFVALVRNTMKEGA